MWNELGISGGTAIIILIALYYVIKWAVKNGIKEAYRAITGEKTNEDIQNEEELKELGLIQTINKSEFIGGDMYYEYRILVMYDFGYTICNYGCAICDF